MAEGLRYLHREQLIHGDFRAANILIDDANNVRVGDFGVAKLADITTASFGSCHAGNSRWLAPELLHESNNKATFSGDIYAFGCVWLEVYTLRVPMAELTEIQVTAKKLQGFRPVWPTMVPANPNLPLEEWEFIQDCWLAEPSSRITIGKLVARARINTLASTSTAGIPIESIVNMQSLFDDLMQPILDSALVVETVYMCWKRNPIVIARALAEYSISREHIDPSETWLNFTYLFYSKHKHSRQSIFSPITLSRLVPDIQAGLPLFPPVADIQFITMLEEIFSSAHHDMSLLGALWDTLSLIRGISTNDILILTLRLLRAQSCSLPINPSGCLGNLQRLLDLSNVKHKLCNDIVCCTYRILYQWIYTVTTHSLMNSRSAEIKDLFLLFLSALLHFTGPDIGPYRILVSDRLIALLGRLEVTEDARSSKELEKRHSAMVKKGILLQMLTECRKCGTVFGKNDGNREIVDICVVCATLERV
ncbi:hypothetical protein QCA50_016113 [Cerrena zonata]|uniref:Protein kinase domain-containing protein n=1 Tax=Cerrena zonata TaxID=2478898 RepID=A0AAW0FMN5_9APHY